MAPCVGCRRVSNSARHRKLRMSRLIIHDCQPSGHNAQDWSERIIAATSRRNMARYVQWRSHGGARVGTCPPYLGQGGSRDMHKFEEFFGGVGMGSKLRMSLKVHRIIFMNTSRKCVCPLQIVYAYLASGGFAPRPLPGLCPCTLLGDFRPPNSCAHPTSKPWLRRWIRHSSAG